MGALFSSPSEPITQEPEPESESKPATLPSKPQENQNPKPMAAISSTPVNNPINPDPNSTNSSSKPQETQNPDQDFTNSSSKPQETQNPNEIQETQNPNEQEDEEEGECGFCLFMKGGECKETFISWEKCVEEGEKNGEDIVNKCYDATSALKKCMEAHPDYYGVILQAEKDAEEEVNIQLEKQKEDNNAAGESDKKPKQEQE
ncbi:uncharacterized protein LOC143554362 [Bidens hawaiensis]|uniref:uncharacterized protein LOC143554362 n=1 Tax=Bidens hawaiensis TaxID=980011 RepID=UPI00404A6861